MSDKWNELIKLVGNSNVELEDLKIKKKVFCKIEHLEYSDDALVDEIIRKGVQQIKNEIYEKHGKSK